MERNNIYMESNCNLIERFLKQRQASKPIIDFYKQKMKTIDSFDIHNINDNRTKALFEDFRKNYGIFCTIIKTQWEEDKTNKTSKGVIKKRAFLYKYFKDDAPLSNRTLDTWVSSKCTNPKKQIDEKYSKHLIDIPATVQLFIDFYILDTLEHHKYNLSQSTSKKQIINKIINFFSELDEKTIYLLYYSFVEIAAPELKIRELTLSDLMNHRIDSLETSEFYLSSILYSLDKFIKNYNNIESIYQQLPIKNKKLHLYNIENFLNILDYESINTFYTIIKIVFNTKDIIHNSLNNQQLNRVGRNKYNNTIFTEHVIQSINERLQTNVNYPSFFELFNQLRYYILISIDYSDSSYNDEDYQN